MKTRAVGHVEEYRDFLAYDPMVLAKTGPQAAVRRFWAVAKVPKRKAR